MQNLSSQSSKSLSWLHLRSLSACGEERQVQLSNPGGTLSFSGSGFLFQSDFCCSRSRSWSLGKSPCSCLTRPWWFLYVLDLFAVKKLPWWICSSSRWCSVRCSPHPSLASTCSSCLWRWFIRSQRFSIRQSPFYCQELCSAFHLQVPGCSRPKVLPHVHTQGELSGSSYVRVVPSAEVFMVPHYV